MREKQFPQDQNLNRWLVSYADLITLLFATFVVLYALVQTDVKELATLQNSIKTAFGAEKSVGIFEDNTKKSPVLLESLSSKYENQSFTQIKNAFDAAGFVGSEARITDFGLVFFVSKSQSPFNSSQTSISPAGERLLNFIGQSVEGKFNSHEIKIEIYQDNLPFNTVKYPSQWEFTGARAGALARYFVENFKLNPNLVFATGCPQSFGRENIARIIILRNKFKHNFSVVEKPSKPQQEADITGAYEKSAPKVRPKFLDEVN